MRRAAAILRRAVCLLGLLCAALGLTVARTARADELSDFEAARALYDEMRFDKAAAAFDDLVGSDPPKLRNDLLVLESRKFYGSALVYLDRIEEARAQFQTLVRAEPEYTMDPMAFPAKVVQLFEAVKKELSDEMRARREAELRARREAEAAREAVLREREARLRSLKELAEQEIVERRNSRWVASVPFGVGQIQNGHRAFGRFLAVSEALLLATTVTTWAVHGSLRGDVPLPSDLGTAEQLERRLRIANYVTFGSFVGLAGYGIVDAHLRFVPSRTVERDRELPKELDRWLETELAANGVRLRF